ncbi:MAG: hypothetical protein COV08_00755 [Candidatus Vogelbacteria bacterium CG10_big_fil_rev_8_21_14_0_10_49_38]|uniref:Cytidyltransferase-like domain-containing protein n=1 Tax=Candidatus Vogelbacteria bacterium CG10_big_fil_rev_8_21_14_0_10_49_38 TaxID=1975043 RepID=A0A2H0RI92_9BACT|nr:MAG: hypothetical protein BK006_00765 [bacterium CG10_49_38]PIR46282.1 MAG: hypothetical protein COV08_00755 [Candidatus Vogelbacteria bacterium CG10_big_fil_rev_8_21_14_0_10_49_38]
MTLVQLGKILRKEDVEWGDRVINNLEELAEVAKYLRASGFLIASTTGVWDLLHVGHCRYLGMTRATGHISIVEVDTDEVVRQRKPDNILRPIVPMDERLEMLAWSRPVDLIYQLVQGEDPIEFIRVMRPDVFVVSETSQDSKEEYLSLVREYCGRIEILPAQANVSTTERVRQMMMAGGVEKLIAVRDLLDRMLEAARSPEAQLKEEFNHD